jgi:antitoxin VapB
MALNIKNPEVERLAGDVAKLAHETKTEAIRRALEERKARLAATHGRPQSQEQLMEFFEKSIWPQVPADVLGKPLSKRDREEILGYGPEGI